MRRPLVFVALLALAAGGCATNGGGWPSASDFGGAAKRAATDPGTWIPLAGAALLMVDDQDAKLTEWAMRERPLFDDKAQDRSDDLEAALSVTYLAASLIAPSESLGGRLRWLGVGATTVALEGGLTRGLKRTFKRERPNGVNHLSLPSGTAGRASVLANLSNRAISGMDMGTGAKRAFQTSVHLMSGAAAWSRLEAGKHHASDVLVGNAIGNFLATFMREAFIEAGVRGVSVSYQPLADGGAVTLSIATR